MIINESKVNGYNTVVREIIPFSGDIYGSSNGLNRLSKWICGYVEIPENHPWYKVDYDELEDKVDVHCGLTYSGDLKREDKWYLGFDCWHDGDHPEEENLEYVLKELEKLVEQVAEIVNKK